MISRERAVSTRAIRVWKLDFDIIIAPVTRARFYNSYTLITRACKIKHFSTLGGQNVDISRENSTFQPLNVSKSVYFTFILTFKLILAPMKLKLYFNISGFENSSVVFNLRIGKIFRVTLVGNKTDYISKNILGNQFGNL